MVHDLRLVHLCVIVNFFCGICGVRILLKHILIWTHWFWTEWLVRKLSVVLIPILLIHSKLLLWNHEIDYIWLKLTDVKFLLFFVFPISCILHFRYRLSWQFHFLFESFQLVIKLLLLLLHRISHSLTWCTAFTFAVLLWHSWADRFLWLLAFLALCFLVVLLASGTCTILVLICHLSILLLVHLLDLFDDHVWHAGLYLSFVLFHCLKVISIVYIFITDYDKFKSLN